MSDTLTPYLGLTKPAVGASDDTWGNKQNADADKIDANASSVNDLIVALTARIAALETATPAEAIGTVKWWPSSYGWPADWAPADGSVHNIGDYPVLAALLRNSWGGDGATTFALPPLMGRVLVGLDMGTGLLQGQYPDAVGGLGGAATVVLTGAQMPYHQHGGQTDNVGDHSHNAVVLAFQTPGNYAQGGSALQLNNVGVKTDVDGAHVHNLETDGQGGNQAHTNCQPGAIGVWIIRVAIT